MHTRGRKLRHYREAVALATRALQYDPDARQGVLSVRAHALMRMARLGFIWKLPEAITDFRQSLKLRISSGASHTNIGESMTDLGLCLVLTGRPAEGFALLQEGVRLMRSDEFPPTGKRFWREVFVSSTRLHVCTSDVTSLSLQNKKSPWWPRLLRRLIKCEIPKLGFAHQGGLQAMSMRRSSRSAGIFCISRPLGEGPKAVDVHSSLRTRARARARASLKVA